MYENILIKEKKCIKIFVKEISRWFSNHFICLRDLQTIFIRITCFNRGLLFSLFHEEAIRQNYLIIGVNIETPLSLN